MDPLSALSLAGTVVQFVDFSFKLFSNAQRLYNSEKGSLVGNDEIELVTTSLIEMTAKLERPLQSGDSIGCYTKSEQQLLDICAASTGIANEILERLNRLKVDKDSRKNKRWESLSKTVKGMWTKKDLDELLGRLQVFRSNLQMIVLVELRYDQHTA